MGTAAQTQQAKAAGDGSESTQVAVDDEPMACLVLCVSQCALMVQR